MNQKTLFNTHWEEKMRKAIFSDLRNEKFLLKKKKKLCFRHFLLVIPDKYISTEIWFEQKHDYMA